MVEIKRALISVSDKTGLGELASALTSRGVELVASGGTAAFLREKGFPVTPVEAVTGNPEAFGGRLKTLSFSLAGAILFRREDVSDREEAQRLGIEPVELIVCNLYPFARLAEEGRKWDELVENIDIGGVTLIRAGAKNYVSVTVLTSPNDYGDFIQRFESGDVDGNYRKELAVKAYIHTASYDGAISRYWEGRDARRELRYGENPHQRGWVQGQNGLAGVVPLQGKPLSWNNLLDADAACRSCWDLHFFAPEGDAVVVIKHGNPCGAAMGTEQSEVLELAWEGDPVSAFGSILCFNRELKGESARWLKPRFVEVIIAPGFSPEAQEILERKKNLRLLPLPPRTLGSEELLYRSIDGGELVQEADRFEGDRFSWEVVTERKWEEGQIRLAAFGERVCRHLKSNAIALVRMTEKGCQLVGAGMGNPNRLVSTEQAVAKARENGNENMNQCVLVSDAFFPFRDNVDLAHREGIEFIVQPGGSRRDGDVIAACNEHGMGMILTGRRHFCH